MKKHGGWYGFDFDGTIAKHPPGGSVNTTGEPIPRMLGLVKQLLAEGKQVRIVTARVSPEWDDQVFQTVLIQAWCRQYIGQELPVQAHKNGDMIVLYDDRAIGVLRNTGVPLHEAHLLADRALAALRIEDVFYERTGIVMDHDVAEAIAAAVLKDAP